MKKMASSTAQEGMAEGTAGDATHRAISSVPYVSLDKILQMVTTVEELTLLHEKRHKMFITVITIEMDYYVEYDICSYWGEQQEVMDRYLPIMVSTKNIRLPEENQTSLIIKFILNYYRWWTKQHKSTQVLPVFLNKPYLTRFISRKWND